MGNELFRVYSPKARVKKDTYSGKIMVRIPPELHETISELAYNKRMSINLFINEALEKACKEEEK